MKISLKTILFTFLGGALGTYARLAVGTAVDGLIENADEVQTLYMHLLTLLVVNVLGAALIGWFNADSRFSANWARAFFATGFAGGFTTMSGVALWLTVESSFSLEAGFMVIALFAIGIASYWLVFAGVRRLISKAGGK